MNREIAATLRSVLRACAVLALLSAIACQKRTSENGDAKRMPKPPPPPHIEVPAGLRITVEVDGHEAPPIDAARLGSLSPDYQDDERRAWRLERLVGTAAQRDGTVFALSADHGPQVVMRPERGPLSGKDAAQPVLVLSRRGAVIATMVVPSDPFPDYHGRGGHLGRGGDPLPRIEGVTALRVSVEGDSASAATR